MITETSHTHDVARAGDGGAAPAPPAASGHLRRVARGGFYSLAGTLVTAAAALGFTAIVTRSLSDPDEAGTLFALTSAFMVVVAVIRLGAPTGLVYFLNRYRKTGQSARIRLVWQAAYVPVVGLALVLGTAGVVAAAPISSFLVGRDDTATVLLTRVLSVVLVCAAVGDLAEGSTRGYGAMRPLVLIARAGRPGLQVLIAAVVVMTGAPGLVSLGLAWAVPFVPAAIALLWWARRLDRPHRVVNAGRVRRLAAPGRRRHAADGGRAAEGLVTGGAHTRGRAALRAAARSERRVFWRFTGPRTVASIAQVTTQRIDIVLLGVLAGPAPAALYTAATRLLAFGRLGGQALNQAIEAKVASLLAIGDTAGVRVIYQVATAWLILLTWPVYLTFAGWAPELLGIFGEGYPDAAAVVVSLSLAMLLGTGVGAVDTMLVMAGRGTWSMLNASAALAVNVVLNLALIPSLGIMGAAVAWVAAVVVNNVVPLVQLATSLRLHPFGRVSMTAAALPVACFAVVPWLGAAVSGGPAGHFAGTAAGAVLYAAGLWHRRGVLQLAAFGAVRGRDGRPA